MSSVDDTMIAYVIQRLENLSAENDVLRLAVTQLINELPADKKFFARVAIGEIIVEHLKKLDLQNPAGETSGELQKAKEMLMNEV